MGPRGLFFTGSEGGRLFLHLQLESGWKSQQLLTKLPASSLRARSFAILSEHWKQVRLQEALLISFPSKLNTLLSHMFGFAFLFWSQSFWASRQSLYSEITSIFSILLTLHECTIQLSFPQICSLNLFTEI